MQGDEVFAQFLLDAGVLPRGVLVRALEQTSQDHPLGDVLVEQGLLSEEDATRALAKALSVPAVVLHHDDIEHEALFAIPEAFSRMHGVVGYKKDHQTLWVAAASLAGAEQIKTLYLPYQVRVHLTDKQSLKRALLRYQRELAERYARQLSSGAAPDIAVDSLLLHALAQGARAVHLTPQDGLLSVGYRIGDALHRAMQLP